MIYLIIVLMIVISIAALSLIPKWQLSAKKDKLELDKYLNLENEYRKTIAQIVGGMYVLGGFAFTWYQLVAAQNTLVLSQERLITDRYSKAIDQLGGASPHTRLGGIYALGSIAKTSPDYVYTVENVLASYIRKNCIYQDSAFIRDELQASVNIITGKQYHIVQSDETDGSFNLSAATLNGFDFNKSSLEKSTLTNADFKRSFFVDANLSGVEANGATFARADLSNASMNGGHFYGVDFTQARLDNASIKNSDLRLANFKEANLSNANLTGCDMTDVNLDRTNLFGADLQRTKGLTKELVKKARINAETKLPNF